MVTYTESRIVWIKNFYGAYNTVTPTSDDLSFLDVIAHWKVELDRFYFPSHPVMKGSKKKKQEEGEEEEREGSRRKVRIKQGKASMPKGW